MRVWLRLRVWFRRQRYRGRHRAGRGRKAWADLYSPRRLRPRGRAQRHRAGEVIWPVCPTPRLMTGRLRGTGSDGAAHRRTCCMGNRRKTEHARSAVAGGSSQLGTPHRSPATASGLRQARRADTEAHSRAARGHRHPCASFDLVGLIHAYKAVAYTAHDLGLLGAPTLAVERMRQAADELGDPVWSSYADYQRAQLLSGADRRSCSAPLLGMTHLAGTSEVWPGGWVLPQVRRAWSPARTTVDHVWCVIVCRRNSLPPVRDRWLPVSGRSLAEHPRARVRGDGAHHPRGRLGFGGLADRAGIQLLVPLSHTPALPTGSV